jgi:C-terminal processing protease CtpA/Prc
VFSILVLLSPTSSITQGDEPGSQSTLTPPDRDHVLEAVVENLQKYYFDPAVAETTAAALRSHQKNGDYAAAKDGTEFAALLTRHLHEASQDADLVVEYSREPIPLPRPPPSADELARRSQQLERANCTIVRAEILPHNIGYLKFDFFPEREICAAKFAAAMNSLDRTDAIILDLRDNRGGMPEMVLWLASYFFDHPEYFFNPREAPSRNSWTRSPTPGSHFANKRAYILTSSDTISGAEQFCYNMKMLKRATLIGETTGGRAHAGAFHRIDDHFGEGIPEVKTLNPYSTHDWEGTGVDPDIKVKAAEALETAQKLVATELHK